MGNYYIRRIETTTKIPTVCDICNRQDLLSDIVFTSIGTKGTLLNVKNILCNNCEILYIESIKNNNELKILGTKGNNVIFRNKKN